MPSDVVGRVVATLRQGAADVSAGAGGDGVTAHRNVVVEYRVGTNCYDGSPEIDCGLRVMTPDGPGPMGNTWVLTPAFFALWDHPPEICWATATDPPLVQVTGTIGGQTVTVNLNPPSTGETGSPDL